MLTMRGDCGYSYMLSSICTPFMQPWRPHDRDSTIVVASGSTTGFEEPAEGLAEGASLRRPELQPSRHSARSILPSSAGDKVHTTHPVRGRVVGPE